MVAESEKESQWLFTDDELLLAPSIVEGGLSPEKERENRGKGVNFILQAGIMLKLPQITLATASVFLHRFYMRQPMEPTPKKIPGHHYYSMAATCLFLATKVEENCRKMKELVIACVKVAQKDPSKVVDEQDREYWRWRDNILHSEDILLEALCFDLSLEAPYKTLFELLLQFRVENNKKLRNSAWAFVNDSWLTMLCLLFPSRVIATGAFYAAVKFSGVAFPDDEEGRPWWYATGVDIADIRSACNYMADMYENVPAKAGREGIVHEKTPDIHGYDDRTRMLGSSREGSSQDETVEAVRRKRDREPESDDTAQPILDTAEKAAKSTDIPEKSPNKRRKLEEGKASADQMNGADSHAESNGKSASLKMTHDKSPSKQQDTQSTIAVPDQPTKPEQPEQSDDVSEEGEVEA